MEGETKQMNVMLSAWQLNIKDQFAAKPEKISQISKNIERLARKMQAIYDDKNYLQYCLIFE